MYCIKTTTTCNNRSRGVRFFAVTVEVVVVVVVVEVEVAVAIKVFNFTLNCFQLTRSDSSAVMSVQLNYHCVKSVVCDKSNCKENIVNAQQKSNTPKNVQKKKKQKLTHTRILATKFEQRNSC